MGKINLPGRQRTLALTVGAVLLGGLASEARSQPAQPGEAKPAPASSAPTGRPMTLAQAMAIAAAQNPDLVIARTEVTASARSVAAAKARRYPSVTFEAQALRWNEPLTFDLSIPGMPADPGATTTIRDQYTATVTGRVVQPLSGLLVISKLVTAERAGLRATRADVAAARLEVIAHAATMFLAALQARELRELASTSITQLDAQLDQARALASVGSLDQVDVMRLDAARAAAEQELVAMEAAVRNAEEQLLLILGLPLETALQPIDSFPETLAPPGLDERQAAAIAMGRPSLRAADARAVQALGARDLARANMLPNVNAVLQADYNEGQSTFASETAWFAGVTLSWNVWDWGTNWHEMKAAGARARGARLSARRARDRVRQEARAAVRTSRAAYQKLDAARRGAAVAEEAYRIQSVRYREGALTTTDLLAAEVDVTRARGALTLARFEYLAALIALRRAMGQSPELAPNPAEGSK